MDKERPRLVDTKLARQPLPSIFPSPGDRIRVPAPIGGWIRTFAGETRMDEAGKWVTKCVGCGDVPAGQVRKV